MLKCPKCGEPDIERDHVFTRSGERRVVDITFKCLFSATFDEGLTDEEMQKKLQEFNDSSNCSLRLLHVDLDYSVIERARHASDRAARDRDHYKNGRYQAPDY